IMFCPSCGSEISVELKYCNRCGANLSAMPVPYAAPPLKPIRLTLPAIVLGLTVTGGIGIILSSVVELARMQVHPAYITWMVIFSMATLFGCTALILRLWLKVFSLNRESYQPQIQSRPPVQIPPPLQQFPPRLEAVPSVTEHTTRTFSPVYREGSDPAAR
ncbi:MAG TPA: zinc ribbon domain-containing protein, partial [Pyrinomonadaceae bacterium]|nr:zinc ribbon domain-containing protein [Pyrinomonadaceae bacterium]